LPKANYIFLVVSVLVESILAVVSVVVVVLVDAAESTAEESEVPIAFLSELQAATDKESAKAKKPNLNVFFMVVDLKRLKLKQDYSCLSD